jgi:DNA polymerase-3 subunit epsilon
VLHRGAQHIRRYVPLLYSSPEIVTTQSPLIAYFSRFEHGEQLDPETTEILLRAITASGRYRIIERLERRPSYTPVDSTKTKMALYVDVETTGLADSDPIIQLAMVPFSFDPQTGRIFNVSESYTSFEDPGIPIPPEITRLTGIADSDVAGKRIDDELVAKVLGDAVLVVAHNAKFDRPRLEARLPAFCELPWACSCDDVPWAREGYRSSRLEWLAYEHCRMFYEAHEAEADCLMGVHLLSSTLPSGGLALHALLQGARQRTARVWAVRSDRSTKERLRRRGYHWNGGEDGRPIAWWRDIPEGSLDAESAWLEAEVYGGVGRQQVQVFGPRYRYSSRTANLPYVDWSAHRRSRPVTTEGKGEQEG